MKWRRPDRCACGCSLAGHADRGRGRCVVHFLTCQGFHTPPLERPRRPGNARWKALGR